MFIFAGFLQEKLRIFLHKARINSIFFYVKSRQELNKWVVRHALSPRAEPLPEYGREGMVAIREFYRKLADDEGTVQFYANHPSKYNSFSIKIVPCLVLESILNTVQFQRLYYERQPVGTNLWIRIRTVFQIIFHLVFGSGFEPYSKLFFTISQDPDSNCYPPRFHTLVMDPDSNRFPFYSFSP